MKLSSQALGALSRAHQKSLRDHSDIVSDLKQFDFRLDPRDPTRSSLIVANPPVMVLDGAELNSAIDALGENDNGE